MPNITCATVNAELERIGFPEYKMYKGKGYYYFLSTGNYEVASLYVDSLAGWTLSEVIDHVLDNIS